MYGETPMWCHRTCYGDPSYEDDTVKLPTSMQSRQLPCILLTQHTVHSPPKRDAETVCIAITQVWISQTTGSLTCDTCRPDKASLILWMEKMCSLLSARNSRSVGRSRYFWNACFCYFLTIWRWTTRNLSSDNTMSRIPHIIEGINNTGLTRKWTSTTSKCK